MYYNYFDFHNLDLTDESCLEPLDPSDYLPIRDDHCPNCDTVGYYTEDLNCDADCGKCLKDMCSKCRVDTELCIKCVKTTKNTKNNKT